MATLKDTAKAYTPQQVKNIAELEAVSVDVPIQERKGKNKEGLEYSYYVAIIMGEEFRVPSTVLNDLKAILSAKPNLKTIKVIKKGTGMATTYTVVPLE